MVEAATTDPVSWHAIRSVQVTIAGEERRTYHNVGRRASHNTTRILCEAVVGHVVPNNRRVQAAATPSSVNLDHRDAADPGQGEVDRESLSNQGDDGRRRATGAQTH